jgi:hypothetical protein
MVSVILCHTTRAAYIDPSFAYASGCDLATAEERELEIEGIDSIGYCKHEKDGSVGVYTDFKNIHPRFWTPGGTITIMPIRRELKASAAIPSRRPQGRPKRRQAA